MGANRYDVVGDTAHMKRERERARELRKSRWWQVQLDQARCYYCGGAVQRTQATMDHILPVSQGGCSTQGNVVLACKACNTQKRDMSAVEWALRQEELRSARATAAAASGGALTEVHQVGDDREE